jgi:hypothetical protein
MSRRAARDVTLAGQPTFYSVKVTTAHRCGQRPAKIGAGNTCGNNHQNFERVKLARSSLAMTSLAFCLLQAANACAHSGALRWAQQQHCLHRDEFLADRRRLRRHVSLAPLWWYGGLSRQTGILAGERDSKTRTTWRLLHRIGISDQTARHVP